MSEPKDELLHALARLVTAGAEALQSYTKLQEKKAEYFENAAQAVQQPEKPFEDFQPGYFEKKYKTPGTGS